MSDIERWTDADAPDEVRELFRAAVREKPRSLALEKTLAAVGVATAAATVATGASAAALPASNVVVVLKWGLGGVLSGLLVAGGASVALDRARPPVATSAASVAVNVAPAPTVVATAVREPTPASIPDEPAVLAPSQAKPSASFEASPEADRLLAAELAIIDAARAAVDAKDGARALRELTKHEQKFGTSGRFLPEARYLKLEALLLAKDRDQARAAAQRILAQDPASPHARRAKSVLEQDP